MAQWKDLTLPWDQHTRRYSRGATRPIKAKILDERPKALLICTTNRATWVPRRLVSHNPETGIVTMPAWLANEKALD